MPILFVHKNISRKTSLHRNPAEDNAPIVKYICYICI